MMTLRRSQDRGHFDHGWLKTFHTFSFGDYRDVDHMGFSVLRVINEDWIAASQGFGTHGHNDMEIITVVVEGALAHKDTMGNGTSIHPGEVQKMSAGTGVRHSEFNHEKNEATHLLQIWILPDKQGYEPSYGQKSFAQDLKTKNLVLVASKSGRDGSIPINQSADVFLGKLKSGANLNFGFQKSRSGWVQVVKGEITLKSVGDKASSLKLEAGDGASLVSETSVELSAQDASEFIFFDLPQ